MLPIASLQLLTGEMCHFPVSSCNDHALNTIWAEHLSIYEKCDSLTFFAVRFLAPLNGQTHRNAIWMGEKKKKFIRPAKCCYTPSEFIVLDMRYNIRWHFTKYKCKHINIQHPTNARHCILNILLLFCSIFFCFRNFICFFSYSSL